ncbi:hypothetical protein [Actinoplanes derwentensis]|uniref:Uncharacterized protein n=1 Tax=Actinoplanes derwentensis TaxID=113562 RepID=A0A1H2D4I7_9ACTN|nr:hypothetical protein [Actinoplanes derwentensis]SDT77661.1 hypothetical protein SAMN04489716_8052 [Actinoplanes derwentensis]
MSSSPTATTRADGPPPCCASPRSGCASDIHVNPPWLHRDPCKYSADIGLTPRTHGWLIERGLALAHYATSRPQLGRLRRWGGLAVRGMHEPAPGDGREGTPAPAGAGHGALRTRTEQRC